MKALVEFEHILVSRHGLVFEDFEGRYGLTAPDLRIRKLLNAIETLEEAKVLQFVSGDNNMCCFRMNK